MKYDIDQESRKLLEEGHKEMSGSEVIKLKNLNDFKIETTENCIW